MSALIWRLSPWDGQVHAFPGTGEVTSEAICEHSALIRRLDESGEHRRCHACLLLHGDELADQIGDRDRYGSSSRQRLARMA